MANSKTGGASDSASASTRSPNLKPATSRAPRMLTPSEIVSLRQDKAKTAAIARRALSTSVR
jgi:hypothetical protein